MWPAGKVPNRTCEEYIPICVICFKIRSNPKILRLTSKKTNAAGIPPLFFPQGSFADNKFRGKSLTMKVCNICIPSGQNRQKTVRRRAFMLIRHSKYSAILSKIHFYRLLFATSAFCVILQLILLFNYFV